MISPQINNIENGTYNKLKVDFELYWHQKLVPFLMQKEQIRKKYLNRFWLLLLISLIVLPFVMWLLAILVQAENDMAEWVGYMAIAVVVFVLRSPYVAYRKTVKKDVMELFVNFFPNFTYCGGQAMNPTLRKDSRIFPKHDLVEPDDCFSGEYNGVEIKIFEETLTKLTRDAKGRRQHHVVFKGISVELVMNKSFSGQTIVVKDSGIFNALNSFSGLERVKLEDVTFEKIFEVHSTDQIEARYLLTSAFMERILKLRSLYKGKKIELSFYQDKVLIAVDTRQDMFEACSFFKTNLNKNNIDRVFEQFLTIFSIVDILKLNQNIGL